MKIENVSNGVAMSRKTAGPKLDVAGNRDSDTRDSQLVFSEVLPERVL